jgi:hypothetical protein
MIGRWAGLYLLLCLPLGLPAAQRLAIGDEVLALRAQARACYLGFIEVYDAAYYRAQAAGSDATRCVSVSYMRDISADDLDESTREIFRSRHGASVADSFLPELERVGRAYQPVAPGDRYTYCVEAGRAGLLLRGDSQVLRIDSADFAERFLQIWVQAEDQAWNPRWAFRRC